MDLIGKNAFVSLFITNTQYADIEYLKNYEIRKEVG